MSAHLTKCVLAAVIFAGSTPAVAQAFNFSTGTPDGRLATASTPGSPTKLEVETADDFFLTQETDITGGTFTGLVPLNSTASNVSDVVLEIYRIFPLDSTSPPSGNVPTRTNSPSDVALTSKDSTAGDLTVSISTLASSFTAAGSIVNVPTTAPFNTGGDGAVTGEEELFSFALATPLDLQAGHYFFVPQVQLSNGTFLWLSTPRPIVSPGTPFPLGATDLQSWIRSSALAPDWLRIGTDIIGAPNTFNAAFSLNGAVVPEPSSWTMMLAGFAVLGLALRRRQRRTLVV